MSEPPEPNPKREPNKTECAEVTGESESLTFRQMFGSALAAMIGVQSRENRERDFAKGKASHFIIVGIVLTLGFVAVMATVVSVVMSLAT